MSYCISRFTVPHPLLASSSHRPRTDLSSSPANFPNLVAVKNGGRRGIAAVAADGRDGLDQLQQRSIKSQPRRRSSPAVAPVGLWDRFPTARTVQQMLETMERLMEDPMAYNGRWSSSSSSSSSSSAPQENGGGYGFGRGRTPWEIKECEGEYKMRFDMPGMTREDVKVWVQERMLVLKAEKAGKKMKTKKSGEEEDEGDEEEEWPASGFGRYGTRIALPENVEFEKIRAEVKDGVLYVTIPKASPTAKVFDISVD
ncbi:hypothetical protein DM860_009734 [Cuscuta australis]|uniref:SHSP domain-containing protein n=1 Tax=Cuscuta australis TaxID=267555 RepID=A0A328DAU6_9ASTE|nr:hypothetical protein DM860_009734 [Cuscuta australis]